MELWKVKPQWLWRLTGFAPLGVARDEWEKQYRSGEWARLDNVEEVAHYAAIVGYVDYVRPHSLLDVGCGHGVLTRRLKAVPYTRYLGIDISEAAIAQASASHGDDRTVFAVADAETWRSADRFDVVIFNECLYYLRDPAEAVARFAAALAPGGHMVVSMFADGRSRAVWPLVERAVAVVDAVTVRHARGAEWTIKLMRKGPLPEEGA